ncbi:ATP-binding cassette domain-containing protein [Novosphingobium piscinae]|uniref:ATP-binding cassette domain-containing protein n=1 Tax=Novosphingobium piscinae TaxID=1507448 RepID=A0A7X1KPJ2_9SPHN|nr:ATP-binding cassette domain-containing protein [Novosphingobium piscinae]MBC2668787.1 ATP-binding cassette domain-containing protein [Novosphingobium piscinae]
MALEVDVTLRRGDRMIAARCTVAPAGITALFGPSGAGKTSVLDAIAGLVRPTTGQIAIDGTVLFDSARGIDLPPEQRRCGYVFQDLRLFPHRRVRDNLLYAWRRLAPSERWLSPDEAIGFLGLGGLLERLPATLSGGEAQRVAIGRALLSAPRFLALDEPLSSLDHARRDEILRVIERIRDELRLPILYVTHDPAEISRLAATVVAVGPLPGS